MPHGMMIKHGIFEALDPGFEYKLAKIVLHELQNLFNLPKP